MERTRSSTPNNTMNSLNSDYSTKNSARPNVPISSCNSTLERPPKLFVHRNAELLKEHGRSDNIIGQSQQYSSTEDDRKAQLLSPQGKGKTAQNSWEPEVLIQLLPKDHLLYIVS